MSVIAKIDDEHQSHRCRTCTKTHNKNRWQAIVSGRLKGKSKDKEETQQTMSDGHRLYRTGDKCKRQKMMGDDNGS